MSTKIKELSGLAFLPFPEQVEMLLSELKKRFSLNDKATARYGDLFYFENLKADDFKSGFPYWARCTMIKPFLLTFDSIGEAAGELKKIQRNWAPYQFTCFRRANLIQEKLPYINLKDRNFPVEIPSSQIGLYTLIDEHTMIASAETSSFLPAGSLRFIEDHENPPSRAYLKIQESLTMARLFTGCELPKAGDRCFEAGACPGGWTWVLAGLGAAVFAVDRAPLADSLMNNPLITFQAHDAFTFKPEEIGPFDWIFSDVICYPERLLQWITMWLEYNPNLKMICTIKMQGEIDWPLIQKFADIPHSRILHLNYNKHELTWIHIPA
ncbi:SAM-dependent methyltransferase [Treponema sp. C6A8]|uniref:SAM-dependent methyltransferase n=1 Tax=Treponema sp. C6A8 TaxID=1410609 RepID=UPI0004851C54|nr:SAM-dependent methyltransferase [Treponema sp. C6A8]